MQVTFYNLAKRTNSTMQPTGAGVTYDCMLKSASGILAPVIELLLPITQAPTWNYCYLAEYGRYYFIRDAIFSGRLWVLSLQVDVLASWKSDIGASTLYILRSASEKDGAIIDTMYPVKVSCTTDMVEQASAWWAIAPAATSGCYIVGVRGRVDASQTAGGVTYLVMTPAQYKTFTESLFADDLGSYLGTDPLGIGDTLAKMIFNPAQYITGVMWLPGTPTQVSAATSDWNVGWWSLGQSLPILNPASRLLYSTTLTINQHPQASSRGSYLNGQPFTQRLLWLPRAGIIQLTDPILAQVAASRGSLSVTLQVDPISGEGLYTLSAGGVTFDTIHVQIGVSVPLSSNEFTLQDAMGAAAAPIHELSAVASGAYNGAIANAGASIGTALAALQPHIVQLSSASGYLGLVGAGTCALYSIYRDVPDDDNAENGRPLCQNKQISTLSGYVQVLNGDIAISGAMEAELDGIRSSLESGFYYE